MSRGAATANVTSHPGDPCGDSLRATGRTWAELFDDHAVSGKTGAPGASVRFKASRDADAGREIVKDPYGAASQTHDDEVAATMADRRSRQLQQVTAALEDINAGRYGICRECEEPIAKARLKVMPFATRCVACQQKLEAEGLQRAA